MASQPRINHDNRTINIWPTVDWPVKVKSAAACNFCPTSCRCPCSLTQPSRPQYVIGSLSRPKPRIKVPCRTLVFLRSSMLRFANRFDSRLCWIVLACCRRKRDSKILSSLFLPFDIISWTRSSLYLSCWNRDRKCFTRSSCA